jgi:mRNA-degrading endonuclease RelE of RelBE toxin-antitoxin system
MSDTFEVKLERAARRSLAEELPIEVAVAANNFIYRPLARNPHRVGKQLKPPLFPSFSARRGEYRVLYLVDDNLHRIVIQSIRHRRGAHRT